MSAQAAVFAGDGSCRLLDFDGGVVAAWATVQAWADQWCVEVRGKQWGPAHDFIKGACSAAAAGVVDALVVLAEATSGDDPLLGLVGAGPLEDLLSHFGNGPLVLDEVDRAARRHPAFRAALQGVWLGLDVPEPVRTRLGILGATLLPN